MAKVIANSNGKIITVNGKAFLANEGGGETWRKWTRPSEWPQYTDSMLNEEVIYLTYDCRDAKAGAKRAFAGFTVKDAYVVERGNISNGVFTAVATTSKTSNSAFFELLPTTEGDYVVYRIKPASGSHITAFSFSSGSQTGYSQNQINALQTCIERFANIANFTGGTNHQSWSCYSLISDTVKGLSSAVTTWTQAYAVSKSLEHCVLEGNLSSCTDLRSLFNGCCELYDLDLSKFYIGSATQNLASFLYNCFSLEYVNLGNGRWDTSGLLSLAQTFQYCFNLRKIDGIADWDLRALKSLDRTFLQCYALSSIATANWETTSQLNNMSCTFYGCYALPSLDLSSMVVSSVTAFDSMCYQCYSLVSIDLSSWEMTSATTLATMFRYCYSLQNVIFGTAGMKTSSALKSLNYTFGSCYNLTSIDLSSAVTSNVTDFRGVFYECYRLREGNISTFNFTSQTTANYTGSLFYYCVQLRSVVLPTNGALWQIGNAMFRYCRSLSTVVFPSTVTDIQTAALSDATSMLVFDFRAATVVPSLSNVNAFNGNTNSVIVVPDALYSQWIAATNWSSLASRIVSASNYTD